MADPFLGEIRPFAFNFVPMGWLPCDGRLLPIQQYSALFALLGTYYGGNGTSNFGLPNLQGRLALGTSSGHPLGETAGAEAVTLTQDQLPSHAHAVSLTGLTATLKGTDNNADQPSPSGGALASNADVPHYSATAPDKALAAGSIAISGSGSATPTGGSQPHPNMPPFVSVTYCIATTGIFPTRP